MKTIALFSWAVVGIVATVVVTQWQRPTEPQQVVQGLAADIGGPIRLVVCSATSARKSSLRNSELITNIVNGLPEHTHVMLLVNDRAAFRIPVGNRRVTFVEMPVDSAITIWPQDPFVVVNDPTGQPELLVSRRFSRSDDIQMATALGKTLELPVRQSKLAFEGGNIVADERFALVGFDTIQTNAEEMGLDVAAVRELFEAEFRKKVIIIGGARQTVGHIDLILTPLGNGQFALADSGWGAEIAKQEIRSSPNSVARFERRSEKEFFGRAGITRLFDDTGNQISRPNVVGQTERAIKFSESLSDELSKINDQLVEQGFDVIRIPALIPGPGTDPAAKSESDPRAGYPFLTYNNVLQQTNDETRKVFLPQYGFTALDMAGKDAWQGIGYKVETIGGFTTSAMHGGSLRCCTKVLLRE